jgi:hypothetical protein
MILDYHKKERQGWQEEKRRGVTGRDEVYPAGDWRAGVGGVSGMIWVL